MLRKIVFAVTASNFLLAALCQRCGAEDYAATAPQGIAGDYSGTIETAGSLDPVGGNEKYAVDQLTVTGAVGAYPLKWTRILNTRFRSWRHSYSWGLSMRTGPEQDPDGPADPPYQGVGGILSYPDGRVIYYKQDGSLWDYGNGKEPLDNLSYSESDSYLNMKDGGVVHFSRLPGLPAGTFLVTEITDPYGLVTTLEYDGNRRLSKVKEPAGRYLKINWQTETYTYTFLGDTINAHFDYIASVEAYASASATQPNESVSYNYEYSNVAAGGRNYRLTGANYDDNTHAIYDYYSTNGSAAPAQIKSCSDPRYSGPMKYVEFEYAVVNGASAGQVAKEKNFNHETVTEIIYPQFGSVYTNPPHPERFKRTERRADGAERYFYYTMVEHDSELASYTDFQNPANTTTITHPALQAPLPATLPAYRVYRTVITDARGNQTWIDKDDWYGPIYAIVHADSNGTPRSNVQMGYTDNYYLAWRRDENEHTTTYTRDNHHRVTDILHPDNSTEHFTYNNFAQVETHTMTNGATEVNTYNNRGLKSVPTRHPRRAIPAPYPTLLSIFTIP